MWVNSIRVTYQPESLTRQKGLPSLRLIFLLEMTVIVLTPQGPVRIRSKPVVVRLPVSSQEGVDVSAHNSRLQAPRRI